MPKERTYEVLPKALAILSVAAHTPPPFKKHLAVLTSGRPRVASAIRRGSRNVFNIIIIAHPARVLKAVVGLSFIGLENRDPEQ